MPWEYDDGGRNGRGKAVADCVVRSIAIASGRPYLDVMTDVRRLSLLERPNARRRGRGVRSNPIAGVWRDTYRRLLEGEMGWRRTATMGIGTGCRTHLRSGEIPDGRLVVAVSKHLTAVVDGVVRDVFDPGRAGTRCVYAYWSPP